MSRELDALAASVAQLRGIVEQLDPEQLTAQAYPTEWTVADVVSHIGSGAVIMHRGLDDALADAEPPDGFAQSVWDEWNAKSPDEQASDALVADQVLLERLEIVTPQERARFKFSMGPISVGFDEFVGLRLSEHAAHTWDVAVTVDPAATILDEATEAMIDNLEMIARFAGKPTDDWRVLHVRTVRPARNFVVTLGPDTVTVARDEAVDDADLELPAEAFVRLVYGRLDPDHTPSVAGAADLDQLRRTFPGF